MTTTAEQAEEELTRTITHLLHWAGTMDVDPLTAAVVLIDCAMPLVAKANGPNAWRPFLEKLLEIDAANPAEIDTMVKASAEPPSPSPPVPGRAEIANQIWRVGQKLLVAGARPTDMSATLLQLALGIIDVAHGRERRGEFLAEAIAAEHAVDEAQHRRLQ